MTGKQDKHANPLAHLRLKRVREPAADDDGCRILVDGLWPRGLTKAAVHLSVWLKEIAPSADLRRQFHQGGIDWPGFEARYRAELDANPEVVHRLRQLLADGPATLLYDAHDPVQNHARVIADYLAARAG